MKFFHWSKISIGFFIAFLIMLVVGIASYQSITHFIGAEQLQRHSYQVLMEFDNLNNYIKDVVLASRGYAITGNPAYLEPYNTSLPKIRAIIPRIEQLISDNPLQLENLSNLERLVQRRVALSVQIISYKQYGKLDSLSSIYSIEATKTTNDSLQSSLAEIQRVENSLLEERSMKLKESSYLTIGVIITGNILAFALIGFSLFQTRKENIHRTVAEAKLNLALSDLSDLYNFAPCGYHSIDANGFIVQINDTELHMLGYTRDEIVNKKKITELLSAESVQTFQSIYSTFMKTGAVNDIEMEFKKKDGSYIPVLINATAIFDSKGNYVKSRSTLFDLTSHRQAEERFNSFFKYSLDMLCIAGFDGYFKQLNPSWSKTLGYSFEELVAKPYLEFVHPDDREATINEATKLTQGKDVILFENRYICKDGSYKWILWNCTMSLKEELIYASARDITEQKNTVQAIVSLNQRLEASNKELEAFSYSVSHDLRAPLRHIAGYVQLVQKHTTAIDDKGKHFLNVISDSAKTMGMLIDDLLDFSRLGRVEMRYSPVDLNILVKEVKTLFDTETKTRSIEWNIQQLPVVYGDYSLLRVVMVNLLSNAIKYTRKQSDPVITITTSEVSGQEAEICVADNGAGFDIKYVDKLFGVFQRLHSATEFEGTGIGLATVRRVIHRHGGKTWAKGETGKGASIYFTIPVADKKPALS